MDEFRNAVVKVHECEHGPSVGTVVTRSDSPVEFVDASPLERSGAEAVERLMGVLVLCVDAFAVYDIECEVFISEGPSVWESVGCTRDEGSACWCPVPEPFDDLFEVSDCGTENMGHHEDCGPSP